MTSMKMTFLRSAASAFLIAVALPCAAADDRAWSASAYGWFPSIIGTTRFGALPGGGSIEVEQDPGEYMKSLNFAFAGTIEARRGPWSAIFDGMYISLVAEDAKTRAISGPSGSVSAPLDTGSKIGVKQLLAGLAAGYSVARSPGSSVDLLGGARYLRFESTLDWHLSGPAGVVAKDGGVSVKKDLWDGFVGFHGDAVLSDHWSLRYYADVGAGSSRLTWQAFGGVAYRYSWGDVTLGYRHLAYDFEADKLVSDIKLSGPMIAGTLRF